MFKKMLEKQIDEEIEKLKMLDSDNCFLIRSEKRVVIVESLISKLGKVEEDLKQKLWDALIEELSRYPISANYWNNFHCRIPSGVRRTDVVLHPTQRDNLKHKDAYPEDIYLSEKRKNQTIHEFHDTVDQAIREVGFTPEQAINARNKAKQAKEDRKKRGEGGYIFEEEWRDFHKIMVPTYLKLREFGYNRSDLIR